MKMNLFELLVDRKFLVEMENYRQLDYFEYYSTMFPEQYHYD